MMILVFKLIKSITDQDHDGIDDQSDIVQNVRKYIETKTSIQKVSIIKVVTQQTIMEYVVMLSLFGLLMQVMIYKFL